MAPAPENDETKPIIRRRDEFGSYAFFKSLPSFLLRPPRDRKTGVRPTPREFALSIGIADEETLDFLDLQTQKGFAAKYGVAEQTLVRWNKQLEGQAALNAIQEWAQPLLSNVVFRLYMQIMTGNAQPGHYKVWFQIVAGWLENQAPKREFKGVELRVVDARPTQTSQIAV